LSLTPAGTDRVQRLFVAHNRREGEWAAVLEPDEQATLTRLLAKIADAARQPWVSHRDAPRGGQP
jgi:DNA-binding MarR family transcriptional regulator